MHDRRRWVLGAWLVGLVLFNVVAGGIGNDFRDDFNLPNVESKRGFDVLEERFGGEGAGKSGSIVFEAEQGVTDPEVQAAMEKLFTQVAKAKGVARVVSPYTKEGARQISAQGEDAGKIAYATVEFPSDADFSQASAVRDLINEKAPSIEGLRIEPGGQLFAEFETPSSEALGLAFAVVILIVAFGSVLAMGLPIGVALFGIGIGSALIMLISNVMAVPEFATILGSMIGLGVGIDYALLIVTRYREQLHAGHDVRESIGIAMDTAGRSVLFAGMTVVISLLGMLLMGVSFVQGLAVAASAVVFVTVLASLTLLPALLGFAGTRIEVTRRRGLIAAGLLAVGLVGAGLAISPLIVGIPLALIVVLVGWAFKPAVLHKEVPRKPPKPLRETVAYRWSRVVQRRPWTVAILSTLALLILAAPLLGLRRGVGDESNNDESTSTRHANDLMVDGVGPGFNGPLLLVAETGKDVAPQDLDAISKALAGAEDVAFASPAVPNEDGTAVQWFVVPSSGPQAEATTQLVSRLRDDVLPSLEDEAGIEVLVTGQTAISIDFSNLLASRLPYFFAAVLILSFLLLMTVFRSLLVPLKAVIMNLLSIGAAYGIIVALFQWGWLGDLTGVEPAPIEPWMPMMLFAIVFGLSMDYEVFLLSRIREEWHRTGDSRRSVADGLAATAKVITAAAAIMVFVFGSFILESDRTAKLMGTGLAMAILLDATVVRMLLVPATMELLGDRNWWLPKWLDRILPNVDVEGHAEDSLFEDDDPTDRSDAPPAPVTV
jgi:RND superfamily putative drug exporter